MLFARIFTRATSDSVLVHSATTLRSQFGSRLLFARGHATVSNLFDVETDVLIVGTGAAGLLAAVRAHAHGLAPLVIEKDSRVGGATAYSGGGMWIPNNHVSRAAGLSDSEADALTYMEATIKEGAPVSSQERKLAFLQNGPKMVKWLEELGFKWRASVGYSDYHPNEPGASTQGRSIEGQIFNLKKLGAWEKHITSRLNSVPVALHTDEGMSLMRPFASLADFLHLLKIVFGRTLGRRLIGQSPATMGKSLVGQLLFMNIERGTDIWRNCPLTELIKADDGVILGAVVDKDGVPTRVGAKKGVLLAAGGFGRNQEMRAKYGPQPSSAEWTSVPPTDTGDAINAGMKIGAATALMGDAWWIPTFMDPNGSVCDVGARSNPFGFIVDSTGSRFMDESESYVDAGHHQYARHQKVNAIPAWLVVDSNHRKRYMLGNLTPGFTPSSAFSSGFLVKANTIEELAAKIGVDVDGLSATTKRFNEMARRGVDEDFGRGSNAYDNVYSDPKIKPNPNLGPVERAPFYAAKMYPGDLGTKGGLLTDENARVLDDNGKPIPGLYGAGNTTASVMGKRYPGPGMSHLSIYGSKG